MPLGGPASSSSLPRRFSFVSVDLRNPVLLSWEKTSTTLTQTCDAGRVEVVKTRPLEASLVWQAPLWSSGKSPMVKLRLLGDG